MNTWAPTLDYTYSYSWPLHHIHTSRSRIDTSIYPESITNSICFAYHFSLDFAVTIPYSHIPCSHRAIIVGVTVTLFQRLINLSPMTKTSLKWNNKLQHPEMQKSLLDFLPCPPIVISCNTLTEIFLDICSFHFYGKGFVSMFMIDIIIRV